MNDLEKFAENLYKESPRGWAELESMKYSIMARTGLDEPDALELAVKIVASPKSIKPKEKKMSRADELAGYLSMTPDELKQALEELTNPKPEAPDFEKIDNALETNAAQLKHLYKAPTANRAKIRNLEAQSEALWAERQAAEQTQADQVKQASAPDRAAKEAALGPLVEEYKLKSRMPSRHKARLGELSAQIETLSREIENG